MLSFFRWVLFFIALLVTVIGGGLFLGRSMLEAQGPLEKTKNVLIPRGGGSRRSRPRVNGPIGDQPAQAPAIWRVDAFKRFQTLTVAIARINVASAPTG